MSTVQTKPSEASDIATPPATRLTQKPRHTVSRKWIAWLIVFLLIVAAVVVWRRTHLPNPLGNIITAGVTRVDLVETVTATGSVTAQTGAEVHIGSQITGTIKKLDADVGRLVKPGQLIAELSAPDLEAQVKSAQAALTAAQMKEQQAETTLQQTISQSSSQVSQAFSTLQSSQQTYLSAKATADQTLQTVPTDVTKAQNALGTAVAALNTARAALTQTKAGIQLQIGVSQQALAQAQANANKAASDESRYHTLYLQGFVAAIDFDLAKTTASVDKSLAVAAQQNLELVKQKVAADLPTAQDQVVTAEQNVLAAEAALKAARSESFSVAAKLDDVRTAGKNVDASQANLKLIRANLQNVTLRQQDVKQDQDAVRQAQQQVDYEQAEFEKSLIRSPISGTVLTLSVQQGETLAAGLAAPTVIVVADLKRLEIDAYVDETDIGKVRLGQPAQVVVDAFPSQTLSGTVTKIYSGSTIQQGVVTYDVVISLEPEHLSLKPDMTATVTIETGNISNALVVPTVAVHNTVSGATINVLVNGSGGPSIKSIQVKTGGTDGVNTQILSGVKEGDTIVVAGTGLSTTKKGPSGPSNPFGPATPRAGGGGGGRAGG